MRNSSVAKRTRSNAVQNRLKRINRTRELQQVLRELHNLLMSMCDLANRGLVVCVNEKVRKLRQLVMTQNIDYKPQLFKLEHRLKAVSYKLKNLQTKLFHTKQIIENAFVGKLHQDHCVESSDCILKMQRKLKEDPLSLERKQSIFGDVTVSNDSVLARCSPLHSAVMNGHAKCVKFLLERGAKVTSLTTEGDNILDSMYGRYGCIYDADDVREDILQLLLEYGFSSLFKEDIFAGELALMLAISNNKEEEVSLLLHHGAIMDRLTSKSEMAEAWTKFNLPAVKLLLLHHRNRLNFGTGFPVHFKTIVQSCYWRMVLPGVPSEEYHEKVLEALQFYKAFGGKFPVCTTKDSDRDLMQYLKSYKHRRYFNDIKLKIKALVSNPLSLQEISRLAVRKYICKNYIENIKELPLPPALQSLLKFDDVIITELPEKYDEFGDDEYSSSSGSEGEDSDMEL